MITDSVYNFEDVVLTPLVGLISGLTGAVLMLVFVLVLQPLTGFLLINLLTQMGTVIGAAGAAENFQVIAGILLHIFLGTIFGCLYALCQQRIPLHGLIAVGLFYGFFLWIMGSVVVGAFLDENLRMMIRSWPWLGACLWFGLCLAATAIWLEWQHPAQAIEPKD